jgi:hypothetical protein
MRVKHLPEHYYEYYQLMAIKDDLMKLEEFKHCDLEICSFKSYGFEYNDKVTEWEHKENYVYYGKMKLYGIYKNRFNGEITILATKTKTKMVKRTYNRVFTDNDPFGEEDWEA